LQLTNDRSARRYVQLTNVTNDAPASFYIEVQGLTKRVRWRFWLF